MGKEGGEARREEEGGGEGRRGGGKGGEGGEARGRGARESEGRGKGGMPGMEEGDQLFHMWRECKRAFHVHILHLKTPRKENAFSTPPLCVLNLVLLLITRHP